MSKAFVIAAPWSNSGKTTLTLGLARYFSDNGHTVQTYKCGPDYIDTIHHTTAARTPSVNLDSMMMSNAHIQDLFTRYSAKADISIVEGVMGLFDGAVKDKGSSAEIAKILEIPVILVVNAKAMAYTVAPILQGLKTFDPEVNIAGVLFNFVRTESHYAFLKEACDTVGLRALGYITPNENIKIPSRHLGLHIEQSFEELIEHAANHVSGVAKKIAGLAALDRPLNLKTLSVENHTRIRHDYTIAVAKDEAFTFTYIENLNYLKQLGKVIFFSPIHDQTLPEADLIYLAGGYPELYLEQLSANHQMKSAIKSAAKKGTKLLAECGGMMYLGQQIINDSGQAFPMVGIFDFRTTMEEKKLHLGYRHVVFEEDNLWGHEFHYSTLIEDHYNSIAKVYTARQKEVPTKVYTYKNVIASYIHLYWAEGNFHWLTKEMNVLKNTPQGDSSHHNTN